MKQQVSPAVIVVAIVVVLAIVAAIAYFVVLKPSKSSAGKQMPDAAKQKMGEAEKQGWSKRGGPAGGGTGSGPPAGDGTGSGPPPGR